MAENFKILPNGNKVTCAVIVQDSDDSILGCHPTGKKPGQYYDLPKGCADAGEEDIDAAIRELREETGLLLWHKNRLMDLGCHSYLPGKDIHLFLYRPEYPIQLNVLKCTSYFKNQYGQMRPEIDDYEMISDWSYFSKSIQKILTKFHDYLLDY